jgi:hypothetical protein
MREALAVILFWGFSVTQARCDTVWTYVPAASGMSPLEGFAVPEVPTERVVVFVGPFESEPRRVAEPVRVHAVDVPHWDDGDHRATEQGSQAFPPGSLWPGPDGRVVASHPMPQDEAERTGIRNPWRVRARITSAAVDIAFICGGLIGGGDGGPVAILNGRVVRRGDSVGRFRVSLVIAEGVLLEEGGLCIVIPRGRRTTVSLVGG